MTEARAGCNASSKPERVLDDPNTPLPIDKGRIKTHLTVLAIWLRGQKFPSRRIDPRHLTGGQPFSGNCMAVCALHFDENQPSAIAHDQVNFPAFAAPSPGQNAKALGDIRCLNLFLGHPPAVMGDAAGQFSAASFRAIW